MDSILTPLVDNRATLRDVMLLIDRNSGAPCIIVDTDDIFVDIVTDGDIRRALLRGTPIENPIKKLLDFKSQVRNHKPIVVQSNTSDHKLLSLMKKCGVRHIPILNDSGKFVRLANQDNIEATSQLSHAVIMAGGLGTRLRPLTDHVPKPMLPVKGKPLLERIVEQLSQQGVTNVFISTFYKSEQIINHFGDGNNFGVSISYLQEKRLTGTAGALPLLPPLSSPILVLNGDIYTNVNFQQMFRFHNEHKADITLGAWQYEYQIEYGVVETEGYEVVGISEKPTIEYSVNTGIYILSPACFELFPKQIGNNQFLHMTDLLKLAITDNLKVTGFPIYESWLDIGNIQDYHKAQTSDVI